MIDPAYLQTMARYGAWQNDSLAIAADALGDDARLADRGGFFGSITATLNHLLWGDRTWMNRFADTPQPRAASIADSIHETPDWQTYRTDRAEMDQTIIDWTAHLDPAWLAGDMEWFSASAQCTVSKSNAMLAIHFFNHATHHRGQVHAMLTAAGAKPDATDLFLLA